MPLPQLAAPEAPVEPTWTFVGTQMASALKNIPCARIERTTRWHGSSAYVVEIYENASENRTDRELADKPVANVERRFIEFVDLRRVVYSFLFTRKRNSEQRKGSNGGAVHVEARQPPHVPSEASSSLVAV
ncbi:hypothetical protein FI667_g3518, partial [Globisporangium splendens]